VNPFQTGFKILLIFAGLKKFEIEPTQIKSNSIQNLGIIYFDTKWARFSERFFFKNLKL